MQRISWVQWLVNVIRKDMTLYEEDMGIKQEVYRNITGKRTFRKGKGASEE